MSDTPSSQPNYAVELICCGKDDGASVVATAEEAHALRDSYVATPGHERVGIIRETGRAVGNYTRGRWLESREVSPVPCAACARLAALEPPPARPAPPVLPADLLAAVERLLGSVDVMEFNLDRQIHTASCMCPRCEVVSYTAEVRRLLAEGTKP